MIKTIKTEEQHQAYLTEVESLIIKSDTLSVKESDQLELLTVLIDEYENNKYPIEQIDPIDAIKFRMNEKGLKQIDLAPYFGTKSRVSEVLSRKRPLTVAMIRALSVGLGLSAETLIGSHIDSNQNRSQSKSIDWSKFPIREMKNRGWIDFNKTTKSAEEQVKNFISKLGNNSNSVAFKRTLKGDSYSPVTKYSLYAWITRVIIKARQQKIALGDFDENILSMSFLKEVAQISWFDSGPILAVEFLQKHGICVVIVPALKGTLVDGAALKDDDGLPIIALTLRHDRLDNFWFTLLHELVHLWKHINKDETFIDDIEHPTVDKIEAEANRVARDIFIPRSVWKRSDAYISPSPLSIDKLSRELRIHSGIIAGRIRRETGDYTKYSDLVGYGEVRKQFEELNFKDEGKNDS